MSTPKKRKAKPTQVESRLRQGATIIAEMTGDVAQPVSYTFADNGKAARADICRRLIADGVMVAKGDGLFPELSQTYGLAQ